MDIFSTETIYQTIVSFMVAVFTLIGQQLPIFSTLNALASEDEKACSQLCASELIEVLKGLENSEALAAGCKVLDTVASKTDDYGRDSLGYVVC